MLIFLLCLVGYISVFVCNMLLIKINNKHAETRRGFKMVMSLESAIIESIIPGLNAMFLICNFIEFCDKMFNEYLRKPSLVKFKNWFEGK